MAKIAKNVKKKKSIIREQRQQLEKLDEQTICSCPHTERGDLNVTPARNRSQGQLLYICKGCEKEVDFTKIPEDELRKACNTIDRACDTIKISLDMQNPHDQELLKEIAKTQYRVRNQIATLYGKSLSKQGTNRRRNRENRGGGMWMQPAADR